MIWSCKKNVLNNNSAANSTRLKTNTTYTTLTQLIVDNSTLIKTVLYDNETTLTTGVTETEIRYTNQGDSTIHMFLLKIDLNQPNIYMEVGTPGNSYTTFGKQTVLDQAKLVNNANHVVYAAINGDFVDDEASQSLPYPTHGPLHKNGAIMKSTFTDTLEKPQQGLTYFGVSASHIPYMNARAHYLTDKPNLYNATGGGVLLVDNYNTLYNTSSVFNPRTAIGYDDHYVYIAEVDGRNSTYATGSDGINYEQLARLFKCFGVKYAINIDGGGSSTFVTRDASGNLGVRNLPGNPSNIPRAVVNSWIVYLSKVMVSTTAGNGTAGLVNGSASGAEFNSPEGVAVDGSGNIYVADKDNNCIRKITTGGTVSVFAGSTSGTAGYTNATGTAARFNKPWKIVYDGTGNFYVADRDNYKIRKITSAGVVTTLAGSTQGFADGTGSAAKFGQPLDVAIDLSGNIIVADNTNHCIRKVTTAGVVTTIAGVHGVSGYHNDANPLLAKFANPSGVTVDGSGNIYVADRTNHVIRKVTPSSGVVFVAGMPFTQGAHDGTGSGASFSNPYGVAVSGSNVLVADLDSSLIRSVTSSGVVTTVAGNRPGFKNADGTNAWLNQPTALVTDASGNIYVADHANNRIRKVVIAP